MALKGQIIRSLLHFKAQVKNELMDENFKFIFKHEDLQTENLQMSAIGKIGLKSQIVFEPDKK